MATKKTNTAPAPVTKEDKEREVARFFAMKKESFSTLILANALHGGAGTRIDGNGKPDFTDAVRAAVQGADLLVELLYKLPEE